jgi:L-arabinose isomerase
MKAFKNLEVWFVTGTQHLYGPEVLEQVAANSKAISKAFNETSEIPVKIVFKPILKTADEITSLCIEANTVKNCIGLITWMHTFSPAKMWITGLKTIQKPILHLHTQFNRDLPWESIDMDFMNLNQSAHGDREFGYMMSRLRINRKVVVGHWQDPAVQTKIGIWVRAAAAWNDMQGMKVARFGDNMRNVAVTEGDKVSAEIALGYSVNGFGMGDLVKFVKAVSDSDVEKLMAVYDDEYTVAKAARVGGAQRSFLSEQARIELGMEAFLLDGNFSAFTTTFEDLHGLSQLPGLAVQRLMAKGYGFGAEGDWKTAALLRSLKFMATGLTGGTSFMEDYTYHFHPAGMKVLGAHMLEVCPSIAENKPTLEVHPLGIGGKDDPARLVFNVAAGPALNASLIDMGNRFRLIINEVDVVTPEQDLPNLPVARAVWTPLPDLQTAAAAWIYAGGAHHTAFSQALTGAHLYDFAEIAGLEHLSIDKNTCIKSFKKELKWNDVYYHLANGLKF